MYQLRRIHFWKEMKDCHDRKWKFCKCPFITWLVLFSKYCRFFVIVFLSITNIKVEQGWMNSCTYYRILHHGRLMHSYNEEQFGMGIGSFMAPWSNSIWHHKLAKWRFGLLSVVYTGNNCIMMRQGKISDNTTRLQLIPTHD